MCLRARGSLWSWGYGSCELLGPGTGTKLDILFESSYTEPSLTPSHRHTCSQNTNVRKERKGKELS